MCNHDILYTIENESNGGVGCPICAAEEHAKRAEKPSVVILPITTRIDVFVIADGLLVNQFADFGSAIAQTQITKEQGNELTARLKAAGWEKRQFMPVGKRFWKNGIKPVRTSGSMQRKRAELEQHPIPGLQFQAIDLAYDL